MMVKFAIFSIIRMTATIQILSLRLKTLCIFAKSKGRVDIDTPIVQQKKISAVEWCKEASCLANQYQKKPWYYLLIPHDEVQINMTFEALTKKYTEK